VFSLCYLFWVLGGPRVLTSYRTSTRGSGVMRCDSMLILLSLDHFIAQPWLCDGMLYEMYVFDAHRSSCVKLRCCVWDTWPNHFWSHRSVILGLSFQSLWWNWSVDLYLVMSCCDMFWLDHFGSLRSVLFWDICRSLAEDRNVLWFTWDVSWLLVENQWIMWFISRYFTVACWEPMDIMINQGCLQLPIENWCDHDYHLILLMEILMFLFCIIFWYFLSSRLYRAEVILWFMIPWA
jgi:hypothetical protein